MLLNQESDDIAKIEKIAHYVCSKMSREELYEDIRQDLCEDWLHGIRPGSLLMKKRATTHILSKKYNRQYAGKKKSKYSFIPYESFEIKEFNEWKHIDDKIYIEQIMPRLTNRKKQFIKLWIHGYTQSEIAKLYSVSRTDVNHLISRSIKQIKERTKYHAI